MVGMHIWGRMPWFITQFHAFAIWRCVVLFFGWLVVVRVMGVSVCKTGVNFPFISKNPRPLWLFRLCHLISITIICGVVRCVPYLLSTHLAKHTHFRRMSFIIFHREPKVCAYICVKRWIWCHCVFIQLYHLIKLEPF